MKIALIAQEESVYFGPFFKAIIEARAQDIVLVAIAPPRGAGGHPHTFWGKLKYLYSLWRLLEPAGFLSHLMIRCFRRNIIEKAAKEKGLNVRFISDVNDPSFLATLKQVAPDIAINQTEQLLKQELLSIPKFGVLNRHASLLPHFRGRVGSFWGHAQELPEYGVTIHFVNEEIDSGPIVIQKKYDLDPRLSFAKILNRLFKESVPLMLEALDRVGCTPLPNNYQGTTVYRFPTLEQIQNYRKTLKKRRK